ncbi:MAG: threonine--tRNA ligase [Tissierellia bacterium]|nr:threonine--tRNA ligase [Tissierellia bacterium]
MIKVKFPDNSVREYEEGILVKDVARDISEGLMRNSLGAVINGKTRGMSEKIKEDCDIRFVNFKDPEGQDIFRHTSSHILALAVLRLFPGVKFAIGPAIKDGFYYDFDLEHRFTPEDLEKIEKEMKKITKEDLKFERIEISKEDAIKHFQELGEEFKVDLIENFPEGSEITLYKLGEFVDLCRGPHIDNIKKVKAIKLLNVAGAYWRGDENNKMLQRIYGTSFEKKKDLDEYLQRLEEAKRRDHRKLGRELDLFSMQDVGPGFPFFHPKGMIVRNELEDFWKKVHVEKGYGEIKTPIILNEALWHQSGHWDHYKDNMYFTKIDGENYAIKPMNCPGSILVYKTHMHSYRDFPLKVAELGLVHRHELSGALHGLFRVRVFTQDDAHIYMLPSQIKDEIVEVIELADYLYSVFGFKYKVELSTKPEDSMGSDEDWEIAINALKEALEEKQIDYTINEGDGAFYGPKIDYHLEDAIGRTWQCGTIQLDFQMPEKFELTYIDENNEKKRPVMVHRAIYGSIERFLGILIEHFEGKFPIWLAPVQVKILPISDKFNENAEELRKKLYEAGIRAEVDGRAEKIGFKIRAAQMEKVPYSLILGQKEIETNTVSVRKRDKGDEGSFSIEDFINRVREEIDTKAIN